MKGKLDAYLFVVVVNLGASDEEELNFVYGVRLKRNRASCKDQPSMTRMMMNPHGAIASCACPCYYMTNCK